MPKFQLRHQLERASSKCLPVQAALRRKGSGGSCGTAASTVEAGPRDVALVTLLPLWRLLLVEQDEFTTCVVIGLLRPMGVSVEVAMDGAEAIHKIENGRFHAAIVDLTLPGANGLEVVGWIRKLVPGLPIALTSGDPEYLEAILDAGVEVDLLIRKPVRAWELYDAVSRLLARAALRGAA